MKYLSILLASLLLSFNAFADYSEENDYPNCKPSNNYEVIDSKRIIKTDYMKEEQSYNYPSQVGPYKIEIYLDKTCHEDIAYITDGFGILDDKDSVLYYSLNDIYWSYNLQETTPSEDFPFYVLQNYTGGAHCCFFSFFLSKDKPYRLHQELYSGDVKPKYSDVDNDGTFEMVVYDNSYTYWKTSFAGSRFIRVIYRVDEDGFHVAQDLIRQEMKYPTVELALQQIRIEIEANEDWVRRNKDMARWLDEQNLHDIGVFTAEFLYAGMEEEAWQFFGQIWEEEDFEISKEEFKTELMEQVFGSEHYLRIIRLNHSET